MTTQEHIKAGTFQTMVKMHDNEIHHLAIHSDDACVMKAAQLIMQARMWTQRGLGDSARSRFEHAQAALEQDEYVGK